MKKTLLKVLTLILTLCTAVCVFTACGGGAGANNGGNNQTLPENYSIGLKYTLINGDTEYEVRGIGTCSDTEIVIPSEYLDKPVTSIGDNAFNSCKSLTGIEIPNSVTSIGNFAFAYCSSLEKIFIPNSVTSIGYKAFFGGYISLVIYCEAESEPSGWDSDWNLTYEWWSEIRVLFGYSRERYELY